MIFNGDIIIGYIYIYIYVIYVYIYIIITNVICVLRKLSMFMFGKSWNFYWVMFTNVFHSYGQLPEGKGSIKAAI